MATNSKAIEAADALKAFKGKEVTVQTAAAAQGGYTTKTEPLAEAHITGARDYGDRVVITTLDGQRHEVVKAPGKAAA